MCRIRCSYIAPKGDYNDQSLISAKRLRITRFIPLIPALSPLLPPVKAFFSPLRNSSNFFALMKINRPH